MPDRDWILVQERYVAVVFKDYIRGNRSGYNLAENTRQDTTYPRVLSIDEYESYIKRRANLLWAVTFRGEKGCNQRKQAGEAFERRNLRRRGVGGLGVGRSRDPSEGGHEPKKNTSIR